MLNVLQQHIQRQAFRTVCHRAATTTFIALGTMFAPLALASDANQTTSVPLSQQALVRLITHELWRTGCLSEGNALRWGRSKRVAAERYLAISGDQAPTRQPNGRLLTFLANAPDNICQNDTGAASPNCFTYDGAEYCD